MGKYYLLIPFILQFSFVTHKLGFHNIQGSHVSVDQLKTSATQAWQIESKFKTTEIP